MIESNVIEQSSIFRFRSVFDQTQCAEISHQILDYKASSQQNADSKMLLNANTGCWMGMPHKHQGFSQSVESLLVEKIIWCCKQYSAGLHQPAIIDNINTDYLDKSQFHIHAWCNVNNPGSENFLHSHPGNFMSGVIWIQAKDTGLLEFVPHNYINKLSHPAWPYHGVSRYSPEDGDIVVFPSYLLHRVTTNTSNKQRITLAFDIEFAEK